MNADRLQIPRSSLAKACGLVLCAALGATSALAAGKTEGSDARARYEQERAACLNGQSNQDRATCLREAGAAFAQARRGGLDDGRAEYERNQRQRCEPLPDEARQACLARMLGNGSISGSVAAGGIYRELVTREPVSPNAAQPASGK